MSTTLVFVADPIMHSWFQVLLTPFGRLRVGSVIGIIESLNPNGADLQDLEDLQHAHRIEISVSGSRGGGIMQHVHTG